MSKGREVKPALQRSEGDLLLTLNAGSSSVKFAVFTPGETVPLRLARGLVEGLGAQARIVLQGAQGDSEVRDLDPAQAPHDHAAALVKVLQLLHRLQPGRPVRAVSHRVVHGGAGLTQPIVVGEAELQQLRALVPLAPLHQPHNLAGIEAARQAFAQAAQVACFDTAFHRSHPFVADTFALPRRFYEQGVRRYGFHGLSYEYIARQLRLHHPEVFVGRVIVAHLGNGASMCAMRAGRSVASTMGFTALDGLPMGTRCGQVDPGVLLYLMNEKGMDAQRLSDLLYRESGLLGLSGLSNDVRELEAAGPGPAQEALDYFADQCRRQIGALAASIGGLDALVLTGGIGENAVGVRRRILHEMGWIGIELDELANRAGASVISRATSAVKVLVLRTDEEAMLAEHAARLLRLTPAL